MANRQPTPAQFNTQSDCENAQPAFRADGTPKTKLYSVGNGLCLQVTPS